MWAFGNHLQVVGVESHLRICNSEVATTFSRPCYTKLKDPNHVIANIEYVGHIEEIVELNYNGLCIVVLMCSWLKANYRGNQRIAKKDTWDFTLANFESCIPLGKKSFAFLMHMEQVFYVDAEEELGWKVMLCKEVRGKRVHENVGIEEHNDVFDDGLDIDHEGLRAPIVIPEANLEPSQNGRNIKRVDTFAQLFEEVNPNYDGNIGDS